MILTTIKILPRMKAAKICNTSTIWRLLVCVRCEIKEGDFSDSVRCRQLISRFSLLLGLDLLGGTF